MTETRHRKESKQFQKPQLQEDQDALESQKAADTAAALERMWGEQEEEPEQPEGLSPVVVSCWVEDCTEKAADAAAQLIERFDQRLDNVWSPAFERTFGKWGKKFGRLLNRRTSALQRCFKKAAGHKRLLRRCFVGGGVAVVALLLTAAHMSAFEYMYNGEVLGMVKDPNEVYQTIDVLGEKLHTASHTKIEIDPDQDITFRRVIGSGLDLDDNDDILNNLIDRKDLKVTGCGIYVDGCQVAVVDSEKEARQILKELTDPYVQQNANKQYDQIGFDQQVEIKPVKTELGKLQKKDSVVNFMRTGSEEKKVHSVTKGETFSQIAQNNGLKLSELTAANPGIDPNRLQIGQELILTKICPVVDVRTVEIASYKIPVSFGVDYENSGAVYIGEQAVKQQGKNGKRQVTAKILRKNGVEQSRTELSSQVVQQPVNQVILVGTKVKPPVA